MNCRRSSLHRTAGQRGASLVVVLLILVVVTLLGAGAAQMSLLAERTSRADRDRQIAFQAAEAALEDAFQDITGARASLFKSGNRQGFVAGCNTGTNRGLCLPSATSVPVWDSVNFTDTATNTATTVGLGEFTGRTSPSGTGSGLVPVQSPRYVIEIVKDRSPGSKAGAVIYRVTAMGFGPSANARVLLQGEFKNQ